MITVNDKIKLFTKRVVESKLSLYDEKIFNLEKDLEKKIEERKSVFKKEKVRYEMSLLKGIKAEKKQRLSNARSEKKRRLLLKRKEMIDSLLVDVKEYTKEFVLSSEYENYIYNEINKYLNEIKYMKEIIIYMRKEDLKKYENFIRDIFLKEDIDDSLFEFKEYREKLMGGIIIVKKDGSSKLDLSLDSVIVENREYMGQLIYTLLEETGEAYE